MNPNAYPLIRIDMEGVRHSLVHALSLQLESDKSHLEKQINATLSDFNFAAVVESTINEALPRLIEEGLRSAIRSRVNDTLWSVEGRALIDAAMNGLIAKSVKRIARRSPKARKAVTP